MKWQRVLRLILVLVAVSTIALVAFSASQAAEAHRRDHGRPAWTRRRVIESAGGRLLQLSGMKVPGFIDFKSSSCYDDGSMKLLGLKLTTHRSGREFYLTANEGKIGKDQSHVEARGNVVLTASDGLRMSTDEAHLQQRRADCARAAQGGVLEGRDERLRHGHDLRPEA